MAQGGLCSGSFCGGGREFIGVMITDLGGLILGSSRVWCFDFVIRLDSVVLVGGGVSFGVFWSICGSS